MRPGKAPEAFLNGAYQGSDFLSFQGYSWKPSPGAGSRAQNVCKLLNRYRVIKEIVKNLLGNTCPRFLAGIAAAGKSELERQGQPNFLSPHVLGALVLVFEFLTHHLFETHNKRLGDECCFQDKRKKWLLQLLR